MATIGLKINDPSAGISDSGLAQTLSDAYFGNPAKQAELTLARAHLLSQQSYQQKLLSDQQIAQQEEARKQYIFNTQREAQDPMAAAAAANVPMPAMPVPVDPTPRAAQQIIGPGPAIVSTDQQQKYNQDLDFHNKTAAAAAAAARVYSMTGNPEESIKAYRELLGVGYVSSAAHDPSAIANPDQTRLGMSLMTGVTPTVNDVSMTGDVAGQQAAAAKDIAVENAKQATTAMMPQLQKIGDTLYRVRAGGGPAEAVSGTPAPNPYGTDDIANARNLFVQLSAKAKTQPLNTVEQMQLAGAQAALNKADTISASRTDTLWRTDPATGQLVPSTPGGGQTGSAYTGTGAEDVSLNLLSSIPARMENPTYRPPIQDAYDYQTGYYKQYMTPKTTYEVATADDPAHGISAGDKLEIQTMPLIPPGQPTPAQVLALARGGAPAVAAPAPPVAGPAPPGTVVSVKKVPSGPAATAAAAPTAGAAPTAAGAATAPLAPPGNSAVGADGKPAASPVALQQSAAKNGQALDVGAVANNDAGTDVGRVPGNDPNSRIIIQKLANGSGTPPTATEQADRTYAARALFATAYLDHMKAVDIPSIMERYFADPSNKGVLLPTYIQSKYSGDVKNVLMNEYAFLTAVLRRESGAAINDSEYRGYGQVFLNQPGDGGEQIEGHTGQRHTWLMNVAPGAYATDPKGYRQFQDLAKYYGVDLNTPPPRLKTGSEKAAAAGGHPETFSDGTPWRPAPAGMDSPELWDHTANENDRRVLEYATKQKAAKAPPPPGQPAIVQPAR